MIMIFLFRLYVQCVSNIASSAHLSWLIFQSTFNATTQILNKVNKPECIPCAGQMSEKQDLFHEPTDLSRSTRWPWWVTSPSSHLFNPYNPGKLCGFGHFIIVSYAPFPVNPQQMLLLRLSQSSPLSFKSPNSRSSHFVVTIEHRVEDDPDWKARPRS